MVHHFCYGSNLLNKRIEQSCPSANRINIGKIKNYRLDFGEYFSKNWNGYIATIVPDKGKTVWGAVWDIPKDEIENLNIQEGVERNIYNTIYVPVELNDGNTEFCYSYQLTKLPQPNNQHIPSLSYISTIRKGAMESNLPQSYISKLKKIKNNGRQSKVEFPFV